MLGCVRPSVLHAVHIQRSLARKRIVRIFPHSAHTVIMVGGPDVRSKMMAGWPEIVGSAGAANWLTRIFDRHVEMPILLLWRRELCERSPLAFAIQRPHVEDA